MGKCSLRKIENPLSDIKELKSRQRVIKTLKSSNRYSYSKIFRSTSGTRRNQYCGY